MDDYHVLKLHYISFVLEHLIPFHKKHSISEVVLS